MPFPYRPGSAPKDQGRLRDWVTEELGQISTAFATPVVRDWGAIQSPAVLEIGQADVNSVTLSATISLLALDAANVAEGTRVRLIVCQDDAGQHRVAAWQNVLWLDGDPLLGGGANDRAYFDLFSSGGMWIGWRLAVSSFIAGAAPNSGGDFTVSEDKFVVSGATGDTRIAGTLSVAGTTFFDGQVAIDGQAYSHCVFSIGYQGASPLSQPHQVAAYSALVGNSYVRNSDGFVAGFETALGVDCGGRCNAVTSFEQASVYVGPGSSVTYIRGLGTYDEHAGVNNAAIADNSSTFTGNWFIYYPNTRPSLLGGNLTVGGDLQIGAGHDLILPGGDVGLTNLSSRFMTVAVGPAPRTTFNYSVTIKGDVSLGSTVAKDLSVTAAVSVAGDASFAGQISVSGDVRWSSSQGFGLMGSDSVRFVSYSPAGGLALNTNERPLTLYGPSWRNTIGASGQAATPPEHPAGYLDVVINGLNCAIPIYFRGS